MHGRVRLVLGCVALAAACHHAPPPAPVPPVPPAARAGPSLYERLGGRPAIGQVVADLIVRVTTDPRISDFFRGVDLDSLRAGLTDQLCQVTGGPCRYTGRPMRDVHASMNLKDADFDALVSDLVAALDRAGVAEREKGELLGILGGLRREIVTQH